ncbi:MAG: sugar phosphate isomerase/epimerase [Bryobacterales bacterium]|nr:sugar phosphate isomerase/epimerase [Bryobacterales bacterium]
MNLSRRRILGTAAGAAVSLPLVAGQSSPPLAAPDTASGQAISLAAWSFSGSFFKGKWKLLEMPGILRDKLGITALEHVNTFFENPTLIYLQKLNKAFKDAGVRQTILMVDGEGSTASPDAAERKLAAVCHRKWIDTAHYLGCHSVRINMHGGARDWKQDPDLTKRAAETIHNMLTYAKGTNLNIIVENHGQASSDPDVLVRLVKDVNDPKFGLLCDLGNWNPGTDFYANSRKTLPYAKGLSVKGTWGADKDPNFDAEKLVKTAYDFGYKGWWGLEVTPRRPRTAPALSADDQFALEVKTILEAKAIVERVVMNKS